MTDLDDVLEVTVHQSILEPVLFLRAPQQPSQLNLFLAIAMLVQFWAWKWLPIALGIHLLLMWIARIEPLLIEMVRRASRWHRYYGV